MKRAQFHGSRFTVFFPQVYLVPVPTQSMPAASNISNIWNISTKLLPIYGMNRLIILLLVSQCHGTLSACAGQHNAFLSWKILHHLLGYCEVFLQRPIFSLPCHIRQSCWLYIFLAPLSKGLSLYHINDDLASSGKSQHAVLFYVLQSSLHNEYSLNPW